MQDLFYLFNTHKILFISFVGLLSLVFGSFLNVVISRLPQALESDWRKQCEDFLATNNLDSDQELSHPSNILLTLFLPCSHCPSCKAPIKFYDNIPIISYFLLLGGKCRTCNINISYIYPLIESLTAILCMIVAWNFGISWQTLAGCFLTCVLITQSSIDFKYKIIPDELTMPTLWLGLLLSICGLYVTCETAIIGAVVGYTVLWLFYWVFYLITKKEGMGYGDFKLLAMLGAWLGWQALPLIIILSSIIGTIVGVYTIIFMHKKRNFRLPFGPFLALAGWIALVWGPAINDWYINFSGIY